MRILGLDFGAKTVGVAVSDDLGLTASGVEIIRRREELLRRFKIPVFLCDERLTTVDAEELMAESGIPRREFKTHVDKVAAMLILTDFLRSHEEEIKNGTLLSEGM